MRVKRLVFLFMAVMAAALLTGCVTATVVKSTDGRAYVADGSWFGTHMVNCDATDGNPECWPVEEQNRE
jgi:uncharacterized protein YceK